MARTYTPEEQAMLSRQFPNVEWVGGVPYTRDTSLQGVASYAADGTPLDYLGNPVEAGEGSLVEANFTERIPWEFILAQVAAPGIVAGGSALLGLGGAGGAGGGGTAAATSAAAPTLSTPILSASALPGAAATGGAAGGGAAAGGGLLGGVTKSGLLSGAGSLVTGFSQGLTDARTEADSRAAQQDVLRTQQAAQEANTEGQRVQLQIQQQEARQREQSDAYRKALLGALGGNIQDVRLDRSGFQSDIPNISFQGGLRPSALGQTGRDAAAILERQALDRLMNPTTPEALPTYEAPQMSEGTPASFWEKLLSPVGTGLTVLGNANRLAPTTQAPGATKVG